MQCYLLCWILKGVSREGPQDPNLSHERALWTLILWSSPSLRTIKNNHRTTICASGGHALIFPQHLMELAQLCATIWLSMAYAWLQTFVDKVWCHFGTFFKVQDVQFTKRKWRRWRGMDVTKCTTIITRFVESKKIQIDSCQNLCRETAPIGILHHEFFFWRGRIQNACE